MKCVTCMEELPETGEVVTCSKCVLKFHFQCSVRETKWRNMSVDQKSWWLCIKCKSETEISRANSVSSNLSDMSNTPTPDEDISTNMLLLKINARLDTLDQVKTTVDGMSSSLSFLNEKYDELLKDIKGYREENKELKKEVKSLKSECAKKDEEVKTLSTKLYALEQYGRGVNLEIHGLEETGYDTSETILEKSAKALGLTYQPSQIQAAHRVPSRGSSRPPMFLVQFVSKATKQQWLIQGRKKKLISKDIVGVGEGRVYFNENLTPYYSALFKETKKVAKEKNYQHQWILNGTIRVKKTFESRVTHIITCHEDLKKLT